LIATLRPTRLTAITALGGLVVTLIVTGIPSVSFAYRNPRLHVALESVEGVIALLAGFLIYGRFKESRRLTHITLAYALSVLGLTNLTASVVPSIVGGATGDALSSWAPLALRLIGAIAVALAALPSDRTLSRSDGVGLVLVLTCVVSVVVINVAAAVFAEYLPQAVSSGAPPLANRPQIEGHPVVLATHFVGMLFYAAAAVGFTTQAETTQDRLLLWTGAGAALAAIARLNYLLYPSLYSEFVYTGDFLRLGFYLFLVVGAEGEVRAFWQASAERALLEERQQIAGYLHDGVAQELALIGGLARRIQNNKGDTVENLRFLESSAERALGEARRAMANLRRSAQQSLSDALSDLAEDFERRYSVKIQLDLEEVSFLDAMTTEGLLRIGGEAIRNAISHSESDSVTIRLSENGGVLLEITDHGRGFDPAGQDLKGFGLTTMKERAAVMGAELSIKSENQEGTTIEVRLASTTAKD
jgi:signal transduction histidine kinase